MLGIWSKIASFLGQPVARSYHSKKYLQYLKSRDWAKKRQEAFRYYGHKCAHCGADQHLQVHHLNYTHLGNEPMRDLQILCYWCHRKEDDERKRQRGLPVKAKRWR